MGLPPLQAQSDPQRLRGNSEQPEPPSTKEPQGALGPRQGRAAPLARHTRPSEQCTEAALEEGDPCACG